MRVFDRRFRLPVDDPDQERRVRQFRRHPRLAEQPLSYALLCRPLSAYFSIPPPRLYALMVPAIRRPNSSKGGPKSNR